MKFTESDISVEAMYHSFYSSSNRFFRLGALNKLKYKDIELFFFSVKSIDDALTSSTYKKQ